MIIAVSGLHGTGKTTIAKRIADRFALKHYSTGMLFRELAKERDMSLEELSRLAEKDRSIDLALDSKIEEYAKKGDCVLDNQLSPYLLGEIVDYCVLLKCAKDVRLRRMVDRDSDDMAKKIQETQIREESERKRFIDYYNVDLLDANLIMGTFDLIVDTTNLNIDSVVATGVEEFEKNTE